MIFGVHVSVKGFQFFSVYPKNLICTSVALGIWRRLPREGFATAGAGRRLAPGWRHAAATDFQTMEEKEKRAKGGGRLVTLQCS